MTAPVVRFRGVGLTYPGPSPVVALDSVNLDIAKEEYVTIVGRSGSGKSSLLNVAGLLDRPTTGTYELDGVDVGLLNEGERSAIRGRSIGFVFQSFHLLPFRSALENVALAQLYVSVHRRLRIRRAAALLDRVGLAHRAHALPTMLSGGERQRVAIARALANDPSLLLCDEPTGNLDTETSAAILDVLAEVNRDGYTIVVITHDPFVAGLGTRQVVLRDGRVDG